MATRRWCERLGIVQDDELTARDLCIRIQSRAGDITDIYTEIPRDMAADRQEKLRRGLRKVLEMR